MTRCWLGNLGTLNRGPRECTGRVAREFEREPRECTGRVECEPRECTDRLELELCDDLPNARPGVTAAAGGTRGWTVTCEGLPGFWSAPRGSLGPGPGSREAYRIEL